MQRLLALAAAGGLLALSVAACGETVIDAAKTEDAIEHNLEKASGLTVTSVDESGNTSKGRHLTIRLRR